MDGGKGAEELLLMIVLLMVLFLLVDHDDSVNNDNSFEGREQKKAHYLKVHLYEPLFHAIDRIVVHPPQPLICFARLQPPFHQVLVE